MNEYDELIQNKNEYDAEIGKDTGRQELRASTIQAVQSNPDTVAQARKLSTKTGIPLSVVERNFDEVSKKEKLNEYDALIDSSPRLAEQMKDSEFAKLAHDDTERLSALEKEFGVWKPVDQSFLEKVIDPFRRGIARSRQARTILFNEAGLYDGANTQLAIRLADQQRRVESFPPAESAEAGLQEIQSARGFGDALSAIFRNPHAVYEVTAESLGLSAPVVAGAIVGSGAGPLGTAAGAGSGSFAIEYASTISEVIAESGASMTDPVDLARALQDEELMSRAREKALKRGIAVGAFDALTAGLAGKLLAGAKPGVVSKAGRVFGEISLQAGGGAGGEATAQVITGEFKPGEILLEAIAEMPTSLIEVPANYKFAVAASVRNTEALEKINSIAEKSKLRQRDPESFAKYIEGLTKDTPAENVMIPVEQWNAYWQSANIDPRTMAQGVAGELAYDEALHTGGDLVIPMSRYATDLAHTEHGKALLPDIRLQATELTQREAEALSKEMEKAAKTEAKPDKIRENIIGQMLATGVDRATAESYASIHAAMARVLGEAGGKRAQELLAQRYGDLRINRPLPDVLKKYAKTDALDVFLDRLRSGDVPTDTQIHGPSLLEFVINQGGLQDQGGELSARDLQKVKRGLVSRKGRTLDDMAEVAHEQGYIKERDPNVLLEAISEEMRGKPVRKAGQADPDLLNVRTAMDELADYLGQLGVNLAETDNITIKKLLKDAQTEAGGQELQQSSLPVFETYEDALQHIEEKGKELGGKNNYLITDEYKALYPRVKELYDLEKSKTGAERMKKLKAAGLAIGDTVSTTFGSMLGGFEEASGLIVDRGGIPYVKLDRKITVSRKGSLSETGSVQWTPQWRKKNEELSKFLDEDVLFQRQKDVKRGAIKYGQDRKFIIELFQKADLSTFLHESGHFFLEVFGDVYDSLKTLEPDKLTPEQKRVMADYEAALKWIGAESRDKIGSEQHEKWAKGFEAYLMEGKAPSSELRAVFAKFRAWLVALYRSIHKLDVQLNDDIRGIMDRLLATEEEIENAERESEIIAVFTDAKTASMSDIEFDAYRKTVEQASQKAKEHLQQKFMAEIRREQEKWWKDERGKVRDEVLAEVNQRPGYIAEAMLRTGKLPDGSELPEGMSPIKLDSKSVEDAHGKDFFKRLPKSMVVKTGGVNSSFAADMLGFSSGESLLMELASLRPKNALVEAETDKRMEERYGNMLLDGAAAVEAQAAVLGDGRAKVIEAEIKALRNLAREVKPFVKAEQKKQQTERREGLAILSAPMASQSIMKQMADGVTAQKRVRDLNPSSYLMAIRRSAKQAVKLASQGDYQGAVMEKQRELLNLELYRAANDAMDIVEKDKKYLGKFDKKSTRDKMRGEAIEQIDELLARFDLRRRSLKAIDAEKQTLAKFVESESERLAAVAPDLPDFVSNEGYRKNFKDMTVEEMRGLVDSVKQLERLARREQEQYMAIRQMNFEQERKTVLDRIRQFHPEAFDENGEPKGLKPDFVPSISKAVKTLGDKFASEFLNAETIMNILEGGEMGDVTRSLFGRMSERSDWKAERLIGIYKKLKPLFKQYSLIEKQQFGRKDIGTPIGIPLTRENAVVVALLYGNKEGRERLMNYGWSDFRIQEIIGLLDEKDMKLVDGIWKLFDEDLWPELKDLNERTRGKAPPKVEPLSYPTKFGPARGGYFRLKYDHKLDKKAYDNSKMEASKALLGGDFGMTAKTLQGTSEERKKGVKLRPRLDFGVLSETIAETVHDLAYRESVADTLRMLNDNSIWKTIMSIYGESGYNALLYNVENIATPPRNPTGFLEKTLSIARKNTIITILSGARTAILNLTGIATVFAEGIGSPETARVDTGLLLRELGKFYSHRMIEMYRFAIEQSVYMRHRFENYDRDLQDTMQNLTVKGKILPTIAMWLWLMGMTDRAVAVPAWNAAFATGMRKFANDVEKSKEHANHVIRQTLGSGRDVDLPRIMAGHGGYGQLKKVFTMLYSYFNAQLNQLVRAKAISAMEAKENRSLAVSRFTGRFMLIFIIPAALSTIGGRDDDDLDEFDDNWAKKFAYAMAMYGSTMFPIFRDLSAFTWSLFDKDVANYGFRISPVQAAGEGIGKGLVSVRDLVEGEADEKDIKNLIMGTSYAVGLPGKQISDTVLGTNAFLEGDAGPTAIIFGPDK